VHTIPFSAVSTVMNMTRDFGYAVFDIGIAYNEDLDRVIDLLRKLGDEMRQDKAFARDIREPIEVMGINRFADTAVIIRARLKTGPGKQWNVEREFNRRLKRLFEEHGIARANPAVVPTIYLSDARPTPQPPSVTGPEPAPQADPPSPCHKSGRRSILPRSAASARSWIGLWTLYYKEVRRFVKVATQTVLAPLVTTLLYLALIVLAIGNPAHKIGDVPFQAFLAPGLIVMGMMQNAFANTSSSIDLEDPGQYRGHADAAAVAGRLTCGFALGGMTRGLRSDSSCGGDDLPRAGRRSRSSVRPVPCHGGLAHAVAARPHRRHLVGEVRPPGGGDELHHHALRLPLRDVLFHRRPAALLVRRRPAESLLLHDRRLRMASPDTPTARSRPG
jgi:hypothetical protein